MRGMRRVSVLAAATCAVAVVPGSAQTRAPPPDSVVARRGAIENEIQELAVVDRKVMIPMRDGIRMPADIYRPRDESKKYATIWVHTPYNFNFWDVDNAAPRDLSAPFQGVSVVRHAHGGQAAKLRAATVTRED